MAGTGGEAGTRGGGSNFARSSFTSPLMYAVTSVPLGMVTSFPCLRRKTGATGQTIKQVATMPSRSLRKKAEDFQVRYEHFHFFQNEQELLDLRPAHSLEIVWLKGLVCASKKSR